MGVKELFLHEQRSDSLHVFGKKLNLVVFDRLRYRMNEDLPHTEMSVCTYDVIEQVQVPQILQHKAFLLFCIYLVI